MNTQVILLIQTTDSYPVIIQVWFLNHFQIILFILNSNLTITGARFLSFIFKISVIKKTDKHDSALYKDQFPSKKSQICDYPDPYQVHYKARLVFQFQSVSINLQKCLENDLLSYLLSLQQHNLFIDKFFDIRYS